MTQSSGLDGLDAKVRLLASLATARQFSARTFTRAQQIPASIRAERSSTYIHRESQPQSSKAAWNITWMGNVFHDTVYDGSPHTQTESILFTAEWDARSSSRNPYASVEYGRRKLPIFFDEWHIRQRLRQRLPKTARPPEQQFLNLGHMDVSCVGILFLECAERNLAFKAYPASIAIPVAHGLVLGEIRQGSPFEKSQSPAMSLSVTQRGRLNLLEAPNYTYHLRIGTFIDYETLNDTKERISRRLERLIDKDTSIVLGEYHLGNYLGMTSPAHLAAMNRMDTTKPHRLLDKDDRSYLETYQNMGGSEGLAKTMQELGALADEALSRLKAKAPNEPFPNSTKADILKL